VRQSDWSAALQDGELKEHADADRNSDLRLKKVWNMMLVKPKQRTDPKYKFSFELISPSGEIDVFQAETDEAMMHWLQVRRTTVLPSRGCRASAYSLPIRDRQADIHSLPACAAQRSAAQRCLWFSHKGFCLPLGIHLRPCAPKAEGNGLLVAH
jgi:hypothetical protein